MNEDKGSERVVLAGLFHHGQDALTDVEDLISTSSFTSILAQYLFNTLRLVIKESGTVDIPTVMTAATRLGYSKFTTDKEYIDYLRSLERYPSKLENVRLHAKTIAKLDITRQLRETHKQCYNDLGEVTGNEPLAEILARSEKPVFDTILKLGKSDENTPENIAKEGEPFLEHLLTHKVDCIGIPSPFPIWNEAVGGGFIRGGVSLLVGRPKSFKSGCALQSALHTALKLKIPTLYLDTELTRLTQQYVRALANISGVPYQKILKGKFDEEKQRVVNAHRMLENSKFEHKRIAGVPFPEIISIIRRWLHQKVGFTNGKANDCLVIYDWFRLSDASHLENMREDQAIGFQMTELTALAGEHEFAVFALGQANRSGITAEDTSIVGLSDRLAQYCLSLSLIKWKTKEEVIEDGKENGTSKVIVMDAVRFGPGLDYDDYLNFQVDGAITRVRELGLKSQAKKDTATVNGNSSDIIF